ncbi:hypothetical protein JCGZ_22793 [Jatropha curcas]|uniref:Uncharacterized protein n=1 Tax=Jatropha curcas TaxID=180498 RepID=A0A067L471_JATCU|nr:hypothetical protein JCGZ_22793 [Jatropha curcas]
MEEPEFIVHADKAKADEDEIPLSRRKKRLRSKVVREHLSRPNVESYIKFVHRASA